MKRIWSHVFTLGLAASAALAAVPACAKNDKSLFIKSVLPPPATKQGGVCVYTADANAVGSLGGLLDIGVRQDYIATLIVGNQLIPRADPGDPRAESNRVHLSGIVSRVTDPGGNTLGELTGYGSGFVDVAANNAPGFGIVSAPVIDAVASNRILDAHPELRTDRNATTTVLVQLRAFGKTLGGEDLESGEFQYVVRVCRGCTIIPDTDPAQGTPGRPNCLKSIDATALSDARPCNLGQDELTNCHLCTGNPLCDTF